MVCINKGIFDFLNFWMFEITCIFEFLNFWNFEFLKSLIFEMFPIFEFLNVWKKSQPLVQTCSETLFFQKFKNSSIDSLTRKFYTFANWRKFHFFLLICRFSDYMKKMKKIRLLLWKCWNLNFWKINRVSEKVWTSGL